MKSKRPEPGSVDQKPLYGCANCSDEYSWPAEDLRVHEGRCWCDDCWQVMRDDGETDVLWGDLPGFVPITAKVKASVAEEFVNSMIGAYEIGFLDSNKLTLATIYQVMRNHCKDEFGVDVESLDVVWGPGLVRSLAERPEPAAVPDDALNAMKTALSVIEGMMQEAYNNAYPECCHMGINECCGSPEPEWSDSDHKIMDGLDPARSALAYSLAQYDGRDS